MDQDAVPPPPPPPSPPPPPPPPGPHSSYSYFRDRMQMPLIPEEPEEMRPEYSRSPRNMGMGRANLVRVRLLSPLTVYNFNNSETFNDAGDDSINTNDHRANRDDDFKDYDCCPQCYCSELEALCKVHNLPTEGINVPEPKEEPVPVEDTVRPMEAYVNETDKLIKKLLAEIDEREKATSN